MPSSLSVRSLALSRRHRGIPHSTSQGFLSPATSPLSTLSADVDTASYCNLRRMVAQRYAPAVARRRRTHRRALNYFDRLPEAVGSDLFGVSDPDERRPERPDEAAGHGIRHREGRRRFAHGRQPRIPHRRLGVDGRP
ncbi:MAG: VWA domain-containing protein [Eggerthellaceae bacterium]